MKNSKLTIYILFCFFVLFIISIIGKQIYKKIKERKRIITCKKITLSIENFTINSDLFIEKYNNILKILEIKENDLIKNRIIVLSSYFANIQDALSKILNLETNLIIKNEYQIDRLNYELNKLVINITDIVYSLNNSEKDSTNKIMKKNDCTFFKNCDSIQTINKRYKSLIKIYHPDNGGDNFTMNMIVEEYNLLKMKYL